VKTTANMTTANWKKAEVLNNQVAISLFTMLINFTLFEQACKYLELCHEERIDKVEAVDCYGERARST
jgi:hypothetical protein